MAIVNGIAVVRAAASFFSLQVISLMLLNNRSVNPSLDASNILSVVDSAEEVEAEWSGGGGRYVDM